MSVGYPLTNAEIAAGLTPANYSCTANPIDVLRYGIVPNNAGAAAANTLALKALLDPTKTGPVGLLVFSPVTGADTYYFNDVVQVRDGIRMDLMGCTLNFAKTRTASDDTMGFFTTSSVGPPSMVLQGRRQSGAHPTPMA
jgi:hypothetical protein